MSDFHTVNFSDSRTAPDRTATGARWQLNVNVKNVVYGIYTQPHRAIQDKFRFSTRGEAAGAGREARRAGATSSAGKSSMNKTHFFNREPSLFSLRKCTGTCFRIYLDRVIFPQSVFSPERPPTIIRFVTGKGAMKPTAAKSHKAEEIATDITKVLGFDELNLVIMALYQVCKKAPMCAAVSVDLVCRAELHVKAISPTAFEQARGGRRRSGSGWRQGRVRWGRPLLSRPRGAVVRLWACGC